MRPVGRKWNGNLRYIIQDGKITCSYRLNPDTVRRIEQWHKANGCEHKNEFIENAVNFYVSYLTLHDNNQLLPAAVKSVIDGRLGQFEEHMAYLLFKQAVETDKYCGLRLSVDRGVDVGPFLMPGNGGTHEPIQHAYDARPI